MAQYNAGEVFQFAIKIEENGEKFYSKLAQSMDDPKARELFSFLAKEEVVHGNIFKDILERFADYSNPDQYPEEYFIYLKTLAENMIFNKDLDKEIERIKTKDDALKFAMQQEWETILYYQELKTLVSDEDKEKIDKLIAEEREHFMKLTEHQK